VRSDSCHRQIVTTFSWIILQPGALQVDFSHPLIEIRLRPFFEESETVVGVLFIGHRELYA
jgi:hypothetical protein